MPSNTGSLIPVGLSILSVFIVAYSLIIAQQILLGVLAAGLPWFVYVLYLLVSSLTRIASAVEQSPPSGQGVRKTTTTDDGC